jgi:hypothetical protein
VSRIAWVPDFGGGPELYQPVEVPEPGDPGWPGADLPEGDPWAPPVNQLRAEIAADYAAVAAEVDARGLEAADFGAADPEPEAEP